MILFEDAGAIRIGSLFSWMLHIMCLLIRIAYNGITKSDRRIRFGLCGLILFSD